MRVDYRFDRVDLRRSSRAYQDHIEQAAADGWRLVQILIEQPAAIASEYVIVLERPAAE